MLKNNWQTFKYVERGIILDKEQILRDIVQGKHTILEEQEPPPQRLPKIFRWSFRLIVFPFMLLDVTIQRTLAFIFKSPGNVCGRCNRCGTCCRYVLMEWPAYLDWLPFLARLYMFWMTEVNGFYLRGVDIECNDGYRYRLLGCRYLFDGNRCKHYYLRPAVCRQYPWKGYYKLPWFLPQCGYMNKKDKS